MRGCRPCDDIIPFYELSRTFKASRVSFRPSLPDILTCAGGIKTDKWDYTTFLTNNEDNFLLYLRFFVVLIFWCLGRKIPKRRCRAEHAHRQLEQPLQHFCQFLGVSAFKRIEINSAAKCNYCNFEFIGGWINNGEELQAEIYRIFREFILL